MNNSINLHLKQKLQLNMTIELTQAIKMLEMNTLEIDEFVSNIGIENPLMEYNKEKTEADIDSYIEKYTYNTDFNGDYSNLFVDKNSNNLQEYILSQLTFLDIDKKLVSYLILIVNHLDEDGYLNTNLYTLAKNYKLDIRLLEKALNILHKLDPLGLGGKDLIETLKLQVENDDILIYIIENHLENIANKKFNCICEDLKINEKVLKDKLEKLKTLNPRPGLQFNIDKFVQYIVPDGKVELVHNNIEITLYDDILPNITLSKFYGEYIKEKDTDTKEYINRQKKQYDWLINSLETRKNTIYSIIEKIVEIQMEYFLNKADYLVPITQKELSEILNISESTVSRVVNNKYIETNKGLLPLSYFFYSGSKDCVSDMVLMDKIDFHIKNENKKKPLSDEKISCILDDEGIKVARRTVAKYRMKLGYESSTKRKELI